MKKTVIIILVIFVITIGGYFGYKAYYLHKYSTDDMEEYYQHFVDLIGEKDTYTVHANSLDDSEYYVFDQLHIKNFFSDFQEEDVSSHLKTFIALTGKNTNVGLFHHETPLYLVYPPLTEKEDATYMKNFMKKHQLDTMLDLFDYLYQNKNQKVGIFDSFSTIRENYVIKSNIGSFALSDNYSDQKITYLTGDHLGYLHEGEFDSNYGQSFHSFVVHLIVDNEEYGFSISTSDEKIDREYVLDLINTIKFE